MTVLLSPDGTPYETDDPKEIKNLQLGHGYRLADDEAAPLPTKTRKARRRKAAEDTD
jgi:hypothetical protein